MIPLRIVITSFFLFLMTGSVTAQNAESIDQALTKAVRSTRGANVALPALEDNRDTGKLSNAVGSAVNKVLKSGLKSSLWSTQGLQPDQVSEIAASGIPFTVLLEMKGDAARQEFEGMVAEELEKAGAIQMIESTNSFQSSDGFVEAVASNTLSALDENGSRMLDNL